MVSSTGRVEFDSSMLDVISRSGTATLTTQLWRHGSRNVFMAGLGSLATESSIFLGEAHTVRFVPTRHDLFEQSRTDREALCSGWPSRASQMVRFWWSTLAATETLVHLGTCRWLVSSGARGRWSPRGRSGIPEP